MKLFFRLPVIALLFSIVLVSCTNNKYGNKIKVEGTKAEIYYKDGATEEDAKKLGDFLKNDGFLTDKKGTSLQVLKENGDFTVRFVYDKEYYEKTEGIESSFKEYADKISKNVFDGKKINIALADEQFKDFKRLTFEEPESPIAKGLAPAAPPAGPMAGDEKFDHDSVGGINFYWKGMNDSESKRIADYIVENGSFAGGTVELYMTRTGNRYIIQFPVKPGYRDKAEFIDEAEKVARQIKDNVFGNNSFSFEITDENLHAVKSFDF